MKKLRKTTENKLGYMVSYEYGGKTNRPHMHAIIFGYSPSKQVHIKNSPSGYPLFTSESISKLWDKGYHSIADANAKTAYYIASYALKGNSTYIVDEETGEEVEVHDKMDVSKKPGIGLKYLAKNAEQLVNSGDILPRYYLKHLEEPRVIDKNYPWIDTTGFPQLFMDYQNRSMENLKARSSHEIYSKHCIVHQKNALHSTPFRADCDYSKKNNRKSEEIKARGELLKKDRNNFADKLQEATRRKTC